MMVGTHVCSATVALDNAAKEVAELRAERDALAEQAEALERELRTERTLREIAERERDKAQDRLAQESEGREG